MRLALLITAVFGSWLIVSGCSSGDESPGRSSNMQPAGAGVGQGDGAGSGGSAGDEFGNTSGGNGGTSSGPHSDAGPACSNDPTDEFFRPCEDAAIEIPDADVPLRECPDMALPGESAEPDPECVGEVATGTFTPVIEWQMQTFPVPVEATEIMSTPIVTNVNDDDGDGDIDDEDIPDIIAVTYGSSSGFGVVRAISGDGSAVHWSAETSAQFTGGAAAGDIDGDGLVEIITLSQDGAIALENDGTVKWETEIGVLAGHIHGISDVPAISDMDHDGSPEIIAGRAVLNADGTLRGAGEYGRGGSGVNVGTCSFASDIDRDGVEEVITGNAVYRPDGSTIWHNAALQDGYPAVANLDDDDEGEIAVSGQGQLRILDTDGTLLNSVMIPGGNENYGGAPTIADFDGDGEPEIGVATGSQYSVIETDGTIRWGATTQDASSGNTGSAVFDFEGDGVAEVVYADETKLWVFSGVDGTVKLESPDHSNGTWLEYPTIADVDNDGHAEIVVANTFGFAQLTGLVVFGDANDSWMPGRRIWNQYAYSITNVNDDGTIPQTAASNWPDYNSFRSGDMTSAGGLKQADLVLREGALCDERCGDDEVTLWVHPGNLGTKSVLTSAEPVISVFARDNGDERLLVEHALTDAVRSGSYGDSVAITVSDSQLAAIDALVLRIGSNDVECNTDNNELVLNGPFCKAMP